MRAINADELPVHKAYCVDEAGFGATFYVVDKEDIDKAPTIDTVPVVRCAECKHFVQSEPYDPCECMKWTVKWGVAYTQPEAFCSCGERRNDG